MFFKRGEVVDLWKESLGRPHWMYYLYDPRDNSLCYIGITKQKFENRLRQHRCPKNTNMAAIAKLQRHLKSIGLTLSGEVVFKGSEELVSKFERYMVTGFKMYAGRDSIKNHQIGGRDAFSCAPESKQKAWATREMKKKKGLYEKREGEKSSGNKLTEKDVLNIYNLIINFFSNNEILEKLNIDVGLTGLNQIRHGKVWKYLWEKEGMKIIPSLKKELKGLPSNIKIQMLKDIEKNLPVDTLKDKYKMLTSDIIRIKNKTLWKPVWKVYEKFIKLTIK